MRVKTKYLLLAATLFVGGLAHIGIAADAVPATPIKCDLRSELKDGFLRLTAIASAIVPASGQYHLVVSKRSESGRSETAQSGTFTLNPDRKQVLTTTLLDSGAIGHYSAKLSIETNAGKISCSSP